MSIAQDSTPSSTTPSSDSQTAQPEQPSAAVPSSPGNAAPRIAPGSIIPVQLTKTIDARKAKTGDEVDAKVTQDLKANNGEVVVPKETKVVGHVTEAQARSKEQKESRVAIAFDHAVMKDGSTETLPMSIQAVIAQPGQNDNANSPGPAAEQNPSQAGSRPGSAMGRSSETGAGASPQAPSSYPTQGPGNAGPANAPAGNSPQHSITANTQGVVGLSDLRLATPGDESQGSVVTSEKTNVKLESGTVMLLRVNH